MNEGTLIWMSIFAVFALIFFLTAAIVSVKGISDIKDLMNDPDLNK